MNHFTYGDRLYEITEIAPVDEDGFHYECCDMTPETGGYLGRIVMPGPGVEGEIVLQLERPVDFPVLLRWMHSVEKLRVHAVDPKTEEARS